MKYIIPILLLFMHHGLHSQCTDESLGDLAWRALAYSPSNIYSCSDVTVTAEWDVESQWPYDAELHESVLIVSLPNEFLGTSADGVSIVASDGMTYWPGPGILTDNEFQIALQGSIPSGTNISIVISNMTVQLDAPFALFNLSQSISLAVADCIPSNDENSITGLMQDADGPQITELQTNCTESNIVIELTAIPGANNGGAITSYNWEGPNGFTSTDEDLDIPVTDPIAQSGTYTVTVTDNKGCKSIESIDATEINCFALPVEFLSFTANKNQDKVDLEWATATEINNDFFEIQRSFDGNKFTTIGQVRGKGTTLTESHYSFVDHSPNRSNYYRLKQVDYNGEYDFSDLKFVSFEKDNHGDFFAYPNPFTSDIYLSLGSGIYKVSLYNIHGELVLNTTYSTGQNISIPELTGGTYIIKAEDSLGVEVLKQIIIKS